MLGTEVHDHSSVLVPTNDGYLKAGAVAVKCENHLAWSRSTYPLQHGIPTLSPLERSTELKITDHIVEFEQIGKRAG
jgi:hypothetical protein